LPFPIETRDDLIRWIDERLLLVERTARLPEQAAEGREVRNAFRLARALGLRGLTEPPGPFTSEAELATLRNLREACLAEDGGEGLATTLDPQRAGALCRELGAVIIRLQECPDILFFKEPAFAEGLNADAINRLADGVVIDERREHAGAEMTRREVIVNHPAGEPSVRWAVWERWVGHEPLNAAKLERTIGHLGAWQRWADEQIAAAQQGPRYQMPPPEWLTVSEAARVSACNSGTITRAADAGHLRTNGKVGRERRICGASLSRWLLRRSNQAETEESNEAVQKLFDRAQRG
jgi:hypothetical protein